MDIKRKYITSTCNKEDKNDSKYNIDSPAGTRCKENRETNNEYCYFPGCCGLPPLYEDIWTRDAARINPK